MASKIRYDMTLLTNAKIIISILRSITEYYWKAILNKVKSKATGSQVHVHSVRKKEPIVFWPQLGQI